MFFLATYAKNKVYWWKLLFLPKLGEKQRYLVETALLRKTS